jgi:phospholipase C
LALQHIFVLVLENRSFDHMLGFSGIVGIDAVSGTPTQINGLISAQISLRQLATSAQTTTASGIVQKKGRTWPPPPRISIRSLLTSNVFNGQSYGVEQPADFAMPVDPGHEFLDVLEQLCGPGQVTQFGGAYPGITNSGFVASYAANGGQSNPGEIMKCYSPSQLPVLNALAREFAVCDNWFASMPGPTCPNRFFFHAASAGGLDHSPKQSEIVKWETVSGFNFKNGTIYDVLKKNNIKWRIYAGDDFPAVASLKGIRLTDIHPYHKFIQDVADINYSISYTFIEPSYNVLFHYKCSTSQHPLDDVTRGESLIKSTYEAIRNSPLWDCSLLIITWDEHGGFYDHVTPPHTTAPGDTSPTNENNRSGFLFEQYGPRVPAVMISPLIPRNLIDHRVYDHASIPATIEACFGLSPLTLRDAKANKLTALASLSNARSDAPTTLPEPANSGIGGCEPFSASTAPVMVSQPISRPQDSLDDGNVPGVLHAALRSDLAASPPEQRELIIARVSALQTRADAKQYIDEVRQKVLLTKGVFASTVSSEASTIVRQ